MPESTPPAPLPRRLAEAGLSHVALVGMPGVGKTSVGRLVAERLNLAFIDLDEAIELAAGMSITQMFQERGEVLFRAQERAVLRAVMADTVPAVLACGGGTWADAAMRRTLATQTLPILLRAPIETLLMRLDDPIERARRPLLGGPDPKAAMRRLERDRERAHARAPLAVETHDKTLEEVAQEVAALIEAPHTPFDLSWAQEPLHAGFKSTVSPDPQDHEPDAAGETAPTQTGPEAPWVQEPGDVVVADPARQHHNAAEVLDQGAEATDAEMMPPVPEPPSWPELTPLPDTPIPSMAEVSSAVTAPNGTPSFSVDADRDEDADDSVWQPNASAWALSDDDSSWLEDADTDAVPPQDELTEQVVAPDLPEALVEPPMALEPPAFVTDPLRPALSVRSGQHTYPVYIADEAEGALETIVSSLCPTRRLALICDTQVHTLFAASLRERLAALGIEVSVHTFVAGEEIKTLKTAFALYDELADANISRRDLIVGLGGGVTLDLAGFVASTYLRGVPIMLVPTSTLAAVDACIGGKNGVNTRRGKNLVGTVYPPRAVFVAMAHLATQSRRAHTTGLVEVLKMGALLDPKLFADVADGSLLNLDDAAARARMRDVLLRALTLKAQVVEDDEHEAGRRAILNYGHTVGHAIEAAGAQTISHGEAVGLGMVAEATWAEAQGLGTGVAAQLKQALEAMNMPVDWRRVKLSVAALGHDKKRVGDELTLPVLKTLGDVCLHPTTLSQLVSYTQPDA